MEEEIKQIKSVLESMNEDEEFIITIPIVNGEESKDGRKDV